MNSSPNSPLVARIARLEAELARQTEILERNEAKALSRETPPRSRFANAAHATKARVRVARIERELEAFRACLPTPAEESRERLFAGLREATTTRGAQDAAEAIRVGPKPELDALDVARAASRLATTEEALVRTALSGDPSVSNEDFGRLIEEARDADDVAREQAAAPLYGPDGFPADGPVSPESVSALVRLFGRRVLSLEAGPLRLRLDRELALAVAELDRGERQGAASRALLGLDALGLVRGRDFGF
jgi:hypothetical protein